MCFVRLGNGEVGITYKRVKSRQHYTIYNLLDVLYRNIVKSERYLRSITQTPSIPDKSEGDDGREGGMAGSCVCIRYRLI